MQSLLEKGIKVSGMQSLLSYHVVQFLEMHGTATEAQFVRIIAKWHEASDGRGLSQLQRSKFNYQMLNLILDEWMPGHKECYDFSTIDIDRYY